MRTLRAAVVLSFAAARVFAQQPDLIESAKQVLQLALKSDWTTLYARFDPAVQKILPEDKMGAAFGPVVSALGAYKGPVAEPSVTNMKALRIVILPSQFENMKSDVTIGFNADGKITGIQFPPGKEFPPYVNRLAFRDSPVIVGTGEWQLPGTLSMPLSQGPHPAVVLVHGSGPEDRDETIGANRPFADIAGGLASRGIAVLRYEKRTRIYGGWFYPSKQFTVKDETTDDVLTAIALLKQTPGVDPNRIFVLGHSLGGMLAPRIAAADPQIAGLVILAGNSRPLEDLIVDQYTYIYSLNGPISPENQKKLDDVKQKVAQIKDPKLTLDSPAVFEVPPSYWLDLRRYNQTETAKSIAKPMLFLQGESDYQVTMKDLDGWKKALGSRKNVTFKTYPGLGHPFVPGTGPSNFLKPDHIPEQVIKDIADWLVSQPYKTDKAK